LIASGRDRVRLVLAPEQALVKIVTLPLATEENLREVIGFELDRHTPFTPAQAYFDVQVVKRDVQNERISVLLAVASRSEVAGLLDTLRRAGLTCNAIVVSGNGPTELKAIDLQPATDKPPRRLSRMHQINLGLLALAALLAFAAVILPIWQKREVVKVLSPLAEKSGTEFQVSKRIYSEYVKLADEYNFLASKKHAVYPVVAVIEELTKTFGDTTWVQRLDIKVNGKAREVTIIGETQSSSKVIENLEQSPTLMFQNSKQITAATRMQVNTERFHVSAEIKPRPVPQLVSIDEQAAPTTNSPEPVPPAAGAPAPLTGAGGVTGMGVPVVAPAGPPPAMTGGPASGATGVATPMQPMPANVPEKPGRPAAATNPTATPTNPPVAKKSGT
jgi:general secretion pathway protein L